MKNSSALIALAVSSIIALGGCALIDKQSSNDSQSEPSNPRAYKACLAFDQGNHDDSSFNQLAASGLEQAQSGLGIDTAQTEPSSPAEFDAAITALIEDEDCTLVIGTGYMLQDSMLAAAIAYPETDFVLVDAPFLPEPGESVPENAASVLFNTAEAAYLAGYAAAGMTTTGKVGVFLGALVPPTANFADGFAEGVTAYNDAKGTAVELVGWDSEHQEGLEIGLNGFDDPDRGRALTEELLAQDVDVIMPVAGESGLGALEAAKAKPGTMIIWVDTDGAQTLPEYSSLILTSVTKHVDVAVKMAAEEGATGEFVAETRIENLANDGVGLAPWHDFAQRVPPELQDEIDELARSIIAGDLSVQTKNPPL